MKVSAVSVRPERADDPVEHVPAVPPPAKSRWSPLFSTMLFLVAFGAGLSLLPLAERGSIRMVVDAAIDHSSEDHLELYVNNNMSDPKVAPIASAKRQRYIFLDLPGGISALRFDPTVRQGVTVRIYGIDFESGEGERFHFGPQELKQWKLVNGTGSISESGDAFEVVAGEDLRLHVDPNISFKTTFVSLAPASLARQGMYWCLAAAAFGFFFLRFGVLRTAALVISTGLGLKLAILTLEHFLAAPGNIPSVAAAVGNSSFTGAVKENEFRGFWAMFAVNLISAAAACFVWARVFRGRTQASVRYCADVEAPPRWWFLVAVWGLLAVFLIPDAPGVFSYGNSVSHSSQFDAQNFYAWQYFFYRGLTPMKDFWYPYSGFYYTGFGAPYPRLDVLVLGALHQFLVFGALLWGLYVLLDYRIGWTAGLFSLLWLLTSYGFLDRTDRYFLSMDMTLLLGAAFVQPGKLRYAAFSGFAIFAYFFEPVQLVYAAAPCFLLLVIQCLREPRRRWTTLVEVAVASVPPLLFIAGHVMWMSHTGALPEFLMFYNTMGASAAGGMLPAPLADWTGWPVSAEGWLFYLHLVVPALCLVYCSVKGWRNVTVRDIAPLAVSLITSMMLQKQLVRPHIALQIIGVPLTAAFLLAQRTTTLPVSRGAAFRSRWWLVLASGLVFGFVIDSYRALFGASWFQRQQGYFASVPSRFSEAMRSDADWTQLAHQYFDPRSYVLDGIDGVTFRQTAERELGLREKDHVYALGDDAFLYIVLGKTAPFHVNLYNQALLYCQKKTVAWLQETAPRFVFWRTAFDSFDGVPNAVRVPLIYSYVVEHYIPYKTLGGFAVLERRQEGDLPDLEFYARSFGPTIDLGFLPSRSEAWNDVTSADATDTPVLKVKVPQPVHGTMLDIPLRLGTVRAVIRMRERAGVQHYAVRLDRLWFAPIAKELHLKLELEAPVFPGGTARLATVRLSKETLF